MQGLLDFIKTPEGQGLLSGVFGYAANAQRGAPINSLGRGGLAGLLGYSNALEREQQAKDNAFQQEYRSMQMEKLRQEADQQKRQQAWRTQLPALMQSKLQGSDAVTNQIAAENAEFGDFGVEKLADLRTPLGISYGPDQNALQSHLMSPDSPFADEILKRQFLPKEAEAFTLGEGQVRYGSDGKIIAQGPQKAPDLPSDVRAYEYAQKQGFKGTFQDWVFSQKRASAPSVSVNLSDPTAVARAGMDLQDKYRNATKGSYARAQAYNAMLEASKNPSPKGDITMVYSLVKAYDPESVVREGEIALLEANRSVPDRIKGYAQKLASGQSLLPNERADMLNQARTLSMTDYQRSRKDIQAYRENAQRLGLDPDLYAADPYAGIDFSPKNFGSTQPMADMPPAAQHKGKTIKDTQTGKLLRSDGMIWKEVK